MAAERRQIITLLTDFGTRDHFVGSMKGVMLSINPDLEIVDITHDVTSHDLAEAAFTLRSFYHYFPRLTIHLAVVDPGVGSKRRPIMAISERYFFIAPDNGLLSFIYEEEQITSVIHITADHYFLKPVSRTFHGRDIFAPVAAWLSKGVEPAKFGEPISDYVKFSVPKVKIVQNALQGMVLHVDKFGNLITNIPEAAVPRSAGGEPLVEKILVGQREVVSIKESYSEGKPGELFAIAGSSGFYEIALNRGSAASALSLGRGTDVVMILKVQPGSTGT